MTSLKGRVGIQYDIIQIWREMEGAPKGHAPKPQQSCRSRMASATTRRDNQIPEKDGSESK